jgi:hypothetical protein
MVLINAISCVSDRVSDCLHKVKVVHKGGMGNKARLASYLYHSDGSIHGSTIPCNLYIVQGILWIIHCTFTKWGLVIEIAPLMWSSLVMSHHANLQQLHHITQATLGNWIVTSNTLPGMTYHLLDLSTTTDVIYQVQSSLAHHICQLGTIAKQWQLRSRGQDKEWYVSFN